MLAGVDAPKVLILFRGSIFSTLRGFSFEFFKFLL